MRTIRPAELESDAPYGPWCCRGRDIWDAFCAAAAGDAAALRLLLERDSNLYRAEYWYTPSLHFAVREGRPETVEVLLEAGADPGATTLQGDDMITLARDRGHVAVERLLEQPLARRGRVAPPGEGSDHAIHAAADQGDVARVRELVDAEPQLLERRDRTGGTPLRRAVLAAARQVVELLLERGADPNATVDSAGSVTFAAPTPELRTLLMAHGGRLDAYDLVWLGEHDEALRRVRRDPAAANEGCGGVLAAACKLGQRELVVQLLDAGARVPPVLTACRSYLMSDPQLLRLLLASGMDPDLPNWQRATPLHDLSGRDGRSRPRPHRVPCAEILLDAGASLDARDEDYRSTPLAWAARSGLPDMAELLLSRGSPTRLPDDEAWATPLAWATRRGHDDIVGRLRAAGATA